jgi:hypothetical protein
MAEVRGYLCTGDGSLVYELEEEETTLGRAEGNDIVLSSSRSISSRHCRLVLRAPSAPRGSGWRARLYDLESLNGTFLNDTRVHNTHAELRSGDSLRLGYDPTIYRFYLAGEQPGDLMGPPAAAPERQGGTLPAAAVRGAGRSTNWEGSGHGRSPLRDYEAGVGSPGRRAGSAEAREPPQHYASSSTRNRPAGISSAEAARRRGSSGSLTGGSPSIARGREGWGSAGVAGAMDYGHSGAGRERGNSPQERMAERRRSLSAAHGRGTFAAAASSSSASSPSRRYPLSPVSRGATQGATGGGVRATSAYPIRPVSPPRQAAPRPSSAQGGGGSSSSGSGNQHLSVSLSYPAAAPGGHARQRSGSANSRLQPRSVVPWHSRAAAEQEEPLQQQHRPHRGGEVVETEDWRGSGRREREGEDEQPHLRQQQAPRHVHHADHRQQQQQEEGEEEEAAAEQEHQHQHQHQQQQEEEEEQQQQEQEGGPSYPTTPQSNYKVLGPVNITLAPNGEYSATDSNGAELGSAAPGGGAVTPGQRSRRPSTASFSITAIGPVTVNQPPQQPQALPASAAAAAEHSSDAGAAAPRSRADSLLSSLAAEPPLAHSPTLEALPHTGGQRCWQESPGSPGPAAAAAIPARCRHRVPG